MKYFHLKRNIYFLVITLLVLFIGIYTNDLANVLRYDRNLIREGEIWRVVSAHFTHLTWSHLLMNLAGFALVFVFFGNLLNTLNWACFTFFSAILISLVLYLSNPNLIWYVGLSGVLHGLLVLGGLYDYKVRRWESIFFLSIIFTKLLWEQIYGALPGSEDTAGGPVLVDAHFYGALSAVIWFTGLMLLKKFTPLVSKR